nr:Xaa-Pro aminopeptidase [Cupriavidus sp.]
MTDLSQPASREEAHDPLLPTPVPAPVHDTAHRQRRQLLSQWLYQKSGGQPALAIGYSGQEVARNRDSTFAFRFSSDFFYLSGFPEPDAWFVIEVDAQGKMHDRLYCRARDPEKEIWDGVRVGPENAAGRYYFDQALPLEALDTDLPGLVLNKTALLAPWAESQVVDQKLSQWLNQARGKARGGQTAPHQLYSLGDATAEQRLIKDAQEIATMSQAAAISAGAHCQAMRATAPGKAEYEIEAVLIGAFRAAGAQAVAYGSIVAGGPHSCILHHRAGSRRMRAGEMLLIDAGCELNGYASDITRSFPVSGRFSPEQRAVYDVVLAAQEAAQAAARPGAAFTDPHQAAVRVITQGLIDLKLITAQNLETAVETEAYKPFYMHRTGHWLGMDVHDVGDYRRRLEPGMVLTLEPGIYIRPQEAVPEGFWNTGIRIEDDALITEEGCRLLTRGVPVAPEAIESLMRG